MTWMPAEWIVPGRTLYGRGCCQDLLREAARFGRKGLLVHGGSLETNGRLDELLAEAPPGLEVHAWRHCGGEPHLEHVEEARGAARRHGVQWVAAVGGGSVLDIGKAAAGLMHAARDVLTYHQGREIEPSDIPFLAVPGTAGTGSEATPVSVLTDPVHTRKASIRHPSFLARVVILDADLLATCPSSVIATAGMDALTQAIEAFCSRYSCGLTDAVSLKAVQLIASSLLSVYRQPDAAAAGALLQGSYWAGVALAHARLGVGHGLAHPLGVRFGVSHGLACAACLPVVLSFNRTAIGSKYQQLTAAMGMDPSRFVLKLFQEMKLTSPFYGKRLADRDTCIRDVLASGSTAANPREVTEADVRQLLRDLLGA